MTDAAEALAAEASGVSSPCAGSATGRATLVVGRASVACAPRPVPTGKKTLGAEPFALSAVRGERWRGGATRDCIAPPLAARPTVGALLTSAMSSSAGVAAGGVKDASAPSTTGRPSRRVRARKLHAHAGRRRLVANRRRIGIVCIGQGCRRRFAGMREMRHRPRSKHTLDAAQFANCKSKSDEQKATDRCDAYRGSGFLRRVRHREKASQRPPGPNLRPS